MGVSKPMGKAIVIASDDPEIMMLQAMITGLTHFNAKALTMRHFKVLMAVKLCIKAIKTEPRLQDIETFIRLPVAEFEKELRDLVALKYLHELVPTFGPLIMRYKLGSMGGTVLRRMMPDVKKTG